MTTKTYQELCEAVYAISEASRHSTDQSFLDDWRRWARLFLSGQYYSKTALRAADSAFVEADERVRGQPILGRVALAAALAARGVAHAASDDDAAGQVKAAAAKTLLDGIDLQRLSKKISCDVPDGLGQPESQRREPAAAMPRARAGR